MFYSLDVRQCILVPSVRRWWSEPSIPFLRGWNSSSPLAVPWPQRGLQICATSHRLTAWVTSGHLLTSLPPDFDRHPSGYFQSLRGSYVISLQALPGRRASPDAQLSNIKQPRWPVGLHFPAVWLWASHLTSLGLGVP